MIYADEIIRKFFHLCGCEPQVEIFHCDGKSVSLFYNNLQD